MVLSHARIPIPPPTHVRPGLRIALRTNQVRKTGNVRAAARPIIRTRLASPPSRIRTYDRSLKRRLLYQLSYGRMGHMIVQKIGNISTGDTPPPSCVDKSSAPVSRT